MKYCGGCKTIKTLQEFYRNKASSDGLQKWCKPCISLLNKQYRDNNKDRKLELNRKWDKENREKRNLYTKNWFKENPKLACYYVNLRKARIELRTPKWLTEEQLLEIRNIYENCPKGHEVDHIVPIKGKNVSGFHVPWNLQYLTKEQNARKYNKFESN